MIVYRGIVGPTYGLIYCIKVYCVYLVAFGLRSCVLLGSMRTPVERVVIMLRVCSWQWKLFVWMMAELCMAPVCSACVSCRVSGVLGVCLCRVESFDECVLDCCCSPSDIPVPVPFSKRWNTLFTDKDTC